MLWLGRYNAIQIKRYSGTQLTYILSNVDFIIKRGIYWWENSLLLVGNSEGLVGIFPTSLLVKKCPDLQSKITIATNYCTLIMGYCENCTDL